MMAMVVICHDVTVMSRAVQAYAPRTVY